MSRTASTLNTEFDSRIVRVSSGAYGITRPKVLTNGMEQVYCVHCHKPSGAMTADLPAVARHQPAPLVLCDACQAANGHLPGFLPSEAMSFGHRREA